MMLHGAAAVHEGTTPVGKTVPSQLRADPATLVTASVFAPPNVVGQGFPTPGLMVQAPVGTAATLSAVLFCRLPSCSKVAMVRTEYMMLNPPRTTVVPLPVTSQAKPRRGEKSLVSGFQREPPSALWSTIPTFGTKLPKRPLASTTGDT